jgi:non-canonical purine NTP pyrophosphatase (RdgB/HAM1 family)
VDAGLKLDERLEDNSKYSVVNGAGGAGLYADRKLSAFPAGTGLLKSNKNHLLDSHKEIFSHIKRAVPHLTEQLDILFEKVKNVLGDETVSFEEVERRAKCLEYGLLKHYPSVVMDSLDDAISIIKFYTDTLDDSNVYFETDVEDITKTVKSDGTIEYNVHLSNKSILNSDYVVLATGRFGPLANFQILKDNMIPRRLEIGFRVDIPSCPGLQDALYGHTMKKNKEHELCCDLKAKLDTPFVMSGKRVIGQARTFCVCDPTIYDGKDTKDKEAVGYTVESRDIFSGITSFSGSSSYDEFVKRCDSDEPTSHLHKGSNLGMMLRFTDTDIISSFSDLVFARCTKEISGVVTLDTEDDIDVNVKKLSEYFPIDLCYVIYNGIISLLEAIAQKSIIGKIKLYGPCVEGVGYYPDVDDQTYQLKNNEGFFVAGDCVGHTRGLLQAMVMGDVVAKYVSTMYLEREISELLMEYQSVALPELSYNKVMSSPEHSEFYFNKHNEMVKLFKSFDRTVDGEKFYKGRYADILQKLFPVKFVGNTGSMGVIYELHHFFLDKDVYGTNGQLHYISQKAMLLYILLCNVVEKNKDMLKSFVTVHAYDSMSKGLKEHLKPLLNSIYTTIDNYLFKSCVLALRTRTSIETRDTYNDVPVMQSAFHFSPFSLNDYKMVGSENEEALKDLELSVVSIVGAYLDTFFDMAIKQLDLPLIMCRTKIETQAPSILPVIKDEEPIYLECHVKVNMKRIDGSALTYHEKKNLIQTLATLVEGADAVDPDLLNVVAVSINLLKHLEYGQQFFLTYRTDTCEEMDYVTRRFSKMMKKLISLVPELSVYQFRFVTDSECVVYDNYRDLDLVWFPVTKNFMNVNYKRNIDSLLDSAHDVFIVTSNPDKLEEYRTAISTAGVKLSLHRSQVELGEPNVIDLINAAKLKTMEAFEKIGHSVVTETTGLVINDKFPGALTGQIIEGMGLDNFIRTYGGQNVTAVTVIGQYNVYSSDEIKLYIGTVRGTILESKPRGSGGFGWDSIFVPNELDGETFAEMSLEKKSKYSMRTRALENYLKSLV